MATTNYEPYLKTALSKYKYSDIAKRDVLNVFRTFKDLRPSSDAYIFNDGSRKDLLNLDGTIPVNYRGAVYNIPIMIWILDTHPYNPPMVYVKPTSTMQIKPGKHVDANGKIDLPYIRDWRYPQSDLHGLIQILVIVFGDDPPVYSKVSQAPARPPYPPGQSGSTPYPSAQGSFQMPTPGQVPPYSPYNANQGGYNQGGGNPPPYQYGAYPSGGQSYPPSTQGYSGYPNQQPPASYPSSQPPYPSANSTPYPTTGYPGYTQNDRAQGTTNVNQPGNTSTVTEEHLRMSLLSAVEDKMKRRLREIFEQAQAEMNVLYKTQTDLTQGKTKLDQMMKDLEQENDQIEGNIRLLKQKDEEIKNALRKLENQGTIDIDEAVITTAPLYRQLLNSFSEEQAIEDAIYYLGDALRKNVIDIEVFLKQVRELSRRQFMLRALIQKCREKAGLPPMA